MVILQGGVPKSGNLWLYRIIQGILKRSGIELKSYIQNHPIHAEAMTWDLSHADHANVDAINIEPDRCYCRISGYMFQEDIPDMDAYLSQCSHVWTHSAICDRSFEILPKFDKNVYIIRDPRDVAISMSRFVFTPHVQDNRPPHYEKDPATFLKHTLDGLVRDWVLHVGGHLKNLSRFGIHVVFYERLLADFDSELIELLDYLEISLSEADRQQIREETSFETMKEQSPNHVRKGKSFGWRAMLSQRQIDSVERTAGEMLTLLNYPASKEDEGNPELPMVPESLGASDIGEAVASAQRGPVGELMRVVGFLLSDRSIHVKWNRIREWSTGRAWVQK